VLDLTGPRTRVEWKVAYSHSFRYR